MSAIKTCYTPDNSCGSEYCSYLNDIYYDNNGNYKPSLFGNCTGNGGGFAALNNGMFFVITSGANGGNANTCSPFCAKITVDVNGFKGPNLWGKDLYGMYVMENGLKPFGFLGDPIPDAFIDDAAKVLQGQSY